MRTGHKANTQKYEAKQAVMMPSTHSFHISPPNRMNYYDTLLKLLLLLLLRIAAVALLCCCSPPASMLAAAWARYPFIP